MSQLSRNSLRNSIRDWVISPSMKWLHDGIVWWRWCWWCYWCWCWRLAMFAMLTQFETRHVVLVSLLRVAAVVWPTLGMGESWIRSSPRSCQSASNLGDTEVAIRNNSKTGVYSKQISISNNFNMQIRKYTDCSIVQVCTIDLVVVIQIIYNFGKLLSIISSECPAW